MKVLLNDNIENLGILGDIVEVKPGYARNYLIPRKLAIAPTKHNLEVMEYKKIKAHKQLELDKLTAIERKQKIETLTITIHKKAGESDTLFGSVTTMELQSKLAELGVEIERKKIHLDEPIKTLGNHICKLKLIADIEAVVKIEVLREGGEIDETAKTKEAEPETHNHYSNHYNDNYNDNYSDEYSDEYADEDSDDFEEEEITADSDKKSPPESQEETQE